MQKYLNGVLVDMTAEEIAAFEAEREANRPTLAQAIVRGLDDLNAAAAKERAKYLTPGKDAVYLQKQSEARACLDDPSPSATQPHPVTGAAIVKYPHLQKMIGVWVPDTGDVNVDLNAAAIYILGRAADLKQISADIELAVDRVKQGIAAAQAVEDVHAAVAGVVWP